MFLHYLSLSRFVCVWVCESAGVEPSLRTKLAEKIRKNEKSVKVGDEESAAWAEGTLTTGNVSKWDDNSNERTFSLNCQATDKSKCVVLESVTIKFKGSASVAGEIVNVVVAQKTQLEGEKKVNSLKRKKNITPRLVIRNSKHLR